MLISLGIGTVVLSSIRDSANVARANEAFYAAEGALEQGLLANIQTGAGYNTVTPQDVDYYAINCPQNGQAGQNGQDNGSNDNFQGCNTVKANYKIQGQVPLDKKYSDGYGIPTPGTGTAGTNCDPLNPVVSGNFYYPPNNPGPNTSFPAQDHPCNWNRIKAGETVNIPLYVTTQDPASNCPVDPDNSAYKICNPADLGLNSLILKLRTPCGNGEEMCQPIGRYKLDTANGDPKVNFNDTVVDWQIVGKSLDGQSSYVMNPIRKYNESSCWDILGNLGRCEPINSEIYEALINTKNNVLAIDTSNNGEGGEDINNSAVQDFILNFLNNQSSWSIGSLLRPTSSKAIMKPILSFSVIHSLDELGTSAPVPFLEYQLISNVAPGILPTNVVQTIIAEGNSGSFKQVLEVKKGQEGGLLEFVIQQ